MLNTLAGPLPRHLYVWADRRFTRKDGTGFEPAVWFGLVSHPGRAWGLTVMLECGAVYRNLPPHAVAFAEKPRHKAWAVSEAQAWDCYGWQWAACVYPYLDGLSCVVRVTDPGANHLDALPYKVAGDYLFSVSPVGDGYSLAPDQAKEFTFVRTAGDRLTVQPTDRVLFREASFTTSDGWPTDIRKQTEVYYCEE